MYNYPNYNASNFNTSNYNNFKQNPNTNDERFGGFVFPFLLGGVTGAAIAPAFWNPGYGYNRPYYPQPVYPYPYPYYYR